MPKDMRSYKSPNQKPSSKHTNQLVRNQCKEVNFYLEAHQKARISPMETK